MPRFLDLSQIVITRIPSVEELPKYRISLFDSETCVEAIETFTPNTALMSILNESCCLINDPLTTYRLAEIKNVPPHRLG